MLGSDGENVTKCTHKIINNANIHNIVNWIPFPKPLKGYTEKKIGHRE